MNNMFIGMQVVIVFFLQVVIVNVYMDDSDVT